MRRVFVAGNWKMNLSRDETRKLVEGLRDEVGDEDRLDLAVAPPFVYLAEAVAAADGSNITVAAQNVYFEEKGAYTGEISPGMLLDVGCTYGIVGHSERRHVIGETDELIARKVKAALDAGLKVILCVGELLDEREAGSTNDVVRTQVVKGLFDLPAEAMADVVIAYEPVWAIGTGVTAEPEDANEVHAFIRALLAEKFGRRVADDMTIQYGGSVKAENAAELMAQTEVDGALVGGASLKVDSFVGIIRNTIEAKGLG
ncbi:MAG TPA: triose-phosphate isomerase [Planctomycetota bacterium]|nr:triose-phosphate isomerase [Planctomycetota bacterium]